MNRLVKFHFRYHDYLCYLKHGMLGDTIRLEASSMCQLNCHLCKLICKRNKLIGWGYLKFFNFKKLIDNNTWIKKIELSNWGEIFLNKELEDIIKYSYYRKICLFASNGVNLNNVSQNVVEGLIKYKFRYITVAIDGASEDTYQRYRKGGNLKNVLNNIKKIIYLKEKYHSRYPQLCWQFIIFGHNEKEIAIARQKAKDLGMDFQIKLNFDESYSPIKDKKKVKKESRLGVVSREEYWHKNKKMYILPCLQLWFSPQINWDGKLLGCCFNTYSDFGNVFESGLKNCLKSEKFIYAKKMLKGKVRPAGDIACSKCSYFQNKNYRTYIRSIVPEIN